MAITGEERHELHKHFEESMGRRMAANLMALLPPEGWGDLVTKQDLAHLEELTDERFTHIGKELAQLERLTDERFTHIGKELAQLERLTDERFTHIGKELAQLERLTDERFKQMVRRDEFYRALWIQGAGLVSVMISLAAVVR